MTKRLFAALLALSMLFTLVACSNKKTTPETTQPGAEQFKALYDDAVATLKSSAAVTLDLSVTETLIVEDQYFESKQDQVIAYSGLGTDDVLLYWEMKVVQGDTEVETEDEEEAILYSELFADDTLYVELKDAATFKGTLSQEAAAARYVPVALLDASLYGEITMETTDAFKIVSFSAPTAAECWAMPADATLLDASGIAEINLDGTMKRMQYTVSYSYGPAGFIRTIEATPRAEALEVSLPEKADSYTELSYPLALHSYLATDVLQMQATTAISSNADTYTSYAAGIEYTDSETVYWHDSGEDVLLKVELDTYYYTADEEGSHSQEVCYKDGKYTISSDGGIPTTQTGVKDSEVRDAAHSRLSTNIPSPEFWQDVKITELNGLSLLEFTFTEDFSNNLQNAICSFLFDDPTVLNQLASKYEIKESTGYLSIEKYTGLTVASGLYYEGAHTIKGDEYPLILQCDQACQFPAYGAYYKITDEYPADAEPEDKATPLFYKVTGADGQQMWLLGTIHVGDERTAYLPQEILDAVAASDALALEINADSFTERVENDKKMQKALSKAYYYQDGSTIEKHLDAELYEKSVQYMKAAGGYNKNAEYMKPGIWQTAISQAFLQFCHTLRSEQGVEERLTQLAKEHEIPIWEVEDAVEHAVIDTNWSKELQILLLEEAVETDLQDYAVEMRELYELWCIGDEAQLRQLINEEPDTSELTEEELAEYEAAKPLMEEYNKGMSYDRNEQMLKVAKKYLESGDVVFYAVGLAHLLDDTNGLVEALRTAGYTVELVEYK